MKHESRFETSSNKGFCMMFENGLSISVQFGYQNYCSRRDIYKPFDAEMRQPKTTSKDAEIAIWDADGTWFNFGSDIVKGWCSTNDVAKWIDMVSTAQDMSDLYKDAKHWGHIEKDSVK